MTIPSTSTRSLTPSSTGDASGCVGFAGVAVLGNALHGQLTEPPVVNNHVCVDAKATLERSLTRGSVVPPFNVAVYDVEPESGALGVNVAIRVAASYVTFAGTSVPAASRSSKVELLIVAGSIASLNVALTVVNVVTPVADAAGDLDVIVGAVVSAA